MELVRAVHSEDLQWESLPGVAAAKLWQERRGALYRTKWICCRGNKDSRATKKYEDFKLISKKSRQKTDLFRRTDEMQIVMVNKVLESMIKSEEIVFLVECFIIFG